MRQTILWRRLEEHVKGPGHDACVVSVASAKGWRLCGTAVFLHEGAPAVLSYDLVGDAAWRTDRGHVKGFLGDKEVDVTVTRSQAEPSGGHSWSMNGTPVAGLEQCEHLDLSFTPATNFPQVRYLDEQAALLTRAREPVAVPVAWLDLPCAALTLLPQTYERKDNDDFCYVAPTVGYAGLLELRPDRLVRVYPGLWEAVEP